MYCRLEQIIWWCFYCDLEVSITENILAVLLPVCLKQLSSDLQCLNFTSQIDTICLNHFIPFLCHKKNEGTFKSSCVVTLFIRRGQLQLLVVFRGKILSKLPLRHFCSHVSPLILMCLRTL